MPDPAFMAMSPDEKFRHLAAWCESLTTKLMKAQGEIELLHKRLELAQFEIAEIRKAAKPQH